MGNELLEILKEYIDRLEKNGKSVQDLVLEGKFYYKEKYISLTLAIANLANLEDLIRRKKLSD